MEMQICYYSGARRGVLGGILCRKSDVTEPSAQGCGVIYAL